MKVKIKKLSPNAVIPKYAKSGDAGLDFNKYVNSRWNFNKVKYLYDNYMYMSCKEMANAINKTEKAVSDKLYKMGLNYKSIYISNNKQTIRTIHSRRRASNKYNAILSRVRGYGNAKNKSYKKIEIKVNREDFIKWYMPLDFEGASVDRIDKNGDYELSNMQVIPLRDNIRKDKIKEHDGLCECYRCHKTKPISQFVKDKRRLNGHSTICIECEKERCKEKYLKSKSKRQNGSK